MPYRSKILTGTLFTFDTDTDAAEKVYQALKNKRFHHPDTKVRGLPRFCTGFAVFPYLRKQLFF